MFRGSVKSIGYPLHSLPLPCVTVCHQVSNALCPPTVLHHLNLHPSANFSANSGSVPTSPHIKGLIAPYLIIFTFRLNFINTALVLQFHDRPLLNSTLYLTGDSVRVVLVFGRWSFYTEGEERVTCQRKR